MRIVILCATQRGYRFVRKLTELAPDCDLVVFSFPEDPWEPRYLADIRELTQEKGGQFYETKQVGSRRWEQFWVSNSIDLMFVVSWRYMIPASVYKRPKMGTFVFHDSLLPEYRGFAPTVWSIINGEDHTGVTLFEIAASVDEGNIIAQQAIPIEPDDTIAVVLEKVTLKYLELLEQNLDKLINNAAHRYQQEHTSATYTSKRLPEDNQINWSAPTDQIYNLIRAVSQPYPGAYTYLAGQLMRIWEAQRVINPRQYIGRVPGRIVEILPQEGSIVLTGDGSLLLTRIQIEGGDIVCAADLLNSVSQTLGI